jgi:glycosidase
VAKLDYSKPELREYIINAMKYWVSGVGVDGFRCDVAAEVPADFWNAAREELDRVKPVFMLAEAEKPELLEYAFDADYGWEFHHLMNGIAQGKKTVLDLEHYLLKSVTTYPKNTIKMNFITNHDENSWNGTEFERMGDAVKTMAALSYLVNGMPLIYSGQEVGFNRRLPFFEKDQITWDDPTGMTAFYQKLNLLKGQSAVLSAGERGADIFRVKSSNDVNVLAFVRENETEKLFAVFNLSPLEQVITLEGDTYTGVYENYMKGDKKTFNLGDTIKLNPWEFSIYKKK